MAVYHHALVLINSSQDGVPLLEHAARMAEENGMRITIAHISTDYRALNYVSDSLRDDQVSQEVIQAKALLNELACTVSLPVDTLSLVTTRRFEDVEACVNQLTSEASRVIFAFNTLDTGHPSLALLLSSSNCA